MIRGIKVTNYIGDSVTMRLDFPFTEFLDKTNENKYYEQGPFYLFGIDGLDPGEADIAVSEYSTLDGAIVNSVRKGPKELTLTLVLNETTSVYASSLAGHQKSIQNAKDKVRKYFPLKTKINIIIGLDNYPEAYTTGFRKYAYYMCDGVVKDVKYDTFAKTCAARVTILMPDPFFYFVGSADNFNPIIQPIALSKRTSSFIYSIYNNASDSTDELYDAHLFYNDYEPIYYDIVIHVVRDFSPSDLTTHSGTDIDPVILIGNENTGSTANPISRNYPHLKLKLKNILNYADFQERGLKGLSASRSVYHNAGASISAVTVNVYKLLSRTGYPDQTKYFYYHNSSWYYTEFLTNPSGPAMTTQEVEDLYGLRFSNMADGDYLYLKITYTYGDIITISSEPGKRDVGISYIKNNVRQTMSINGILDLSYTTSKTYAEMWPYVDHVYPKSYGACLNLYPLLDNNLFYTPISYTFGKAEMKFYSKKRGL